MSDNVAVTPGSGASIAADEVTDGVLGTVKVQFVKIMDGTLDGTGKASVGTNGLKVDPTASGVALANNQTTMITSLAAIATDIHSIATDASNVVTVGVITVKTSTFTRPADTTAYAIGDLVANSTSAGSVTPMSFVAASVNAGSGMARKARIRKSGTSVSNASFRLHLWSVAPTVSTAGDNGLMSNVTGISNYAGAFDITCDRAFADGSVGGGGAHSGAEVNYVCASGDNKLYGLLEATGAYTPTSGEVFNIDLELLPN